MGFDARRGAAPRRPPPPLDPALTQRLLLVGAGHAHAQVLRDWIAAPVPGVDLVLVSPSSLAPYSGMVPGWLAGVYRFDEICIDFAALAAAAGARLLIDELVALDPDRRQAHLASGQVLGYDLLSLNVGSTLRPPPLAGPGQVLALRPLGELRQRWESLLANPALAQRRQPLRITAVGGGAAGVEALLAVLACLRQRHPGQAMTGRLVTRGALLPGMAAGARRAALAALAAADAQVLTDTAFDAGSPQDAPDLLLWATGAQSHAWQASSGLAVSAGGFIGVNARLQSLSHPQVLAVGDCAHFTDRVETPLPKAGVFAVRMGPVLSHNLRALLFGQALQRYRPQRRYLALLATADGRAIGAWSGLAAQGRWLWHWKDRIDRGFLARFALPGPGAAGQHRSANGEPP